MRYRIVLCGFSEFEYRAMHFSFQHPVLENESQFDVVEALGDADFAIVDADSQSAVQDVFRWGRLGDAVFVGTVMPPGASWHLPRPIDPTRILRMLDELTAQHDTLETLELITPGEPSHPSHPNQSNDTHETHETHRRTSPSDFDGVPTLDDVVFPSLEPLASAEPHAFEIPAIPSESEAQLPLEGSSASASASASHSAKKAAARAAARRARLASLRAEPGSQESLRDVLVIDADNAASAHLCALLQRFGFTTYCVRSVGQASEHLALRLYAAILMDIALDGPGLALLEQIQTLPLPLGQAAPAVLLVRARSEPSDRVRAALAGIAPPLIKPLSRGDLARALEDCRVALPSDERRI
jgi:CheY-like chemotaxis protein